MNINFHAFVFTSTIIVYIILKSYKKSKPEYKKTSNLIYVLLVPVVLYSGNYYFNKNINQQNILIETQSSINDAMSENLLTKPYPISSDSFSI
jgi:multisubunit Na+/H+ antiporter MnhB subunit